MDGPTMASAADPDVQHRAHERTEESQRQRVRRGLSPSEARPVHHSRTWEGFPPGALGKRRGSTGAQSGRCSQAQKLSYGDRTKQVLRSRPIQDSDFDGEIAVCGLARTCEAYENKSSALCSPVCQQDHSRSSSVCGSFTGYA